MEIEEGQPELLGRCASSGNARTDFCRFPDRDG
jgi:hypothetical protein